MNKFGKVAIRATELIINNTTLPPRDAWIQAIKETTTTISSLTKGCPRSAFLGLCEEGLILNVPSGRYLSEDINKTYCLTAVQLLKDNATNEVYFTQPAFLWKQVMITLNKKPISHNGQMDVILALAEKGYLKDIHFPYVNIKP